MTAPDGAVYQLSGCQSAPEFRRDRTYDLELCYSAKPIPLTPERINIDPDLFRIGDTVYLAGVGCTESGGPDSKFGTLRIGPATIANNLDAASGHSNLLLIGSALCPGDAGGGTFVSTDAGWKLIGVNSRSDRDVTSTISLTSIPTFVAWAKSWSVEHTAPICGLDEAGCAAVGGVINSEPASEIKTLRMMRVFAHKGDTMSTVVLRSCGQEQAGSYYKALEEYHKTYSSKANSNASDGAGIDAYTEFGFDREISIPVCASNPSRLQKRIVSPGETAWSIWDATKDKAKLTGPWKYRRDKDNDKPSFDSEYFVDVLIALNRDNKDFKIQRLPAGRNILIPLGPLLIRAQAGKAGQPLSPAIFIDGPRPIFAAANGSCDENIPGPDYPYDLKALLDVLRNNRISRKLPGQVKVLIADTGLAGPPSNGFFSDEMFFAASETLGITPRILPSLEGYNHGTEVASVVAGGPLFARIQSLGLPRIALGILPIYVMDRSFVRANNNWAMLVREAAKDLQIVNLSLEVRGLLEATELFGKTELLFVVAAGNDYTSLFKEDIFPAKLGGEAGNIITVAAVLRKKSDDGTIHVELADFSNYWRDFVDIGAPGCGVPSIAFEKSTWNEVNADGTSFATPLVSFAAALIKSEARLVGLTPLQIKRRLLASSDLSLSRASQIRDGRVLNLVKAVSLYQDVIQKKNKELLFGSLQFTDGDGNALDALPLTCDELGAVEVEVKKIIKVWPSFTADQKAMVYMMGGPQQVMLSKPCSLPSDLKIKVIDTANREVDGSPFKLEELRDIVPRLF